eukprot:CAMPEP_0170551128 /NCGR_PEP_ID=MMETSP0211-20121228/9152_1 /TAXON_ID=311385 /ORGANISM="Pseudokeronopsis sp., Strain OXSARD2" /LENGTH=63 /DNA_ID=CAMNT_0010858103 /DNA_START=483 /DNA_END=674 /DNA_ORIENTATION=+
MVQAVSKVKDCELFLQLLYALLKEPYDDPGLHGGPQADLLLQDHHGDLLFLLREQNPHSDQAE